MKLKLIGIALIVVLGIALFFQTKTILKQNKTIARISDNVELLAKDKGNMLVKLDSFRSESKTMAQTVSELKESFPEMVQLIRNEGIKAKNILTVSNSIYEFARKFQMPVHDSELIIKGDTVQAKCAEFYDQYLQFSSCEYNGESYASIVIPDTILNVLHKKSRSFFEWIKGEPKQYYQFVKNTNKYVQPIWRQVVIVEKK